MLIYVRSFVNNRKISLEVNPTTTVSQLIDLIHKVFQDIVVKRVLFAGQVLNGENTLESYRIVKECAVQVMGVRRKDDDEEIVPIPNPKFARQVTSPSIQFGDVLLVELIAAKNLKKSDYFRNSSDPYVILSMGNQIGKSSVISRNLNPKWNEKFLFHIFEGGPQKLTFMAFDHDYLSSDDPLGSAEIELTEIERDVQILRHLKLEHVSTGEIIINLKRAALTSESMVYSLLEIIKLESHVTDQLLRKHKISLNQLIGEDDYFIESLSGRIENPALKSLSESITSQMLQISNERTRKKVFKILRSQKAIFNDDLPSRHVYVVNAEFSSKENEKRFIECLKEISENFIQRFSINIRGGTALLSFESAEKAILTLSLFKQLFTNDHEWGYMRFSFSSLLQSDHYLLTAKAATFANLSGPHILRRNLHSQFQNRLYNSEWATYLVVLTASGRLIALSAIDRAPKFDLNLLEILVINTGPYSFQISDSKNGYAYFFRDSKAGRLSTFKKKLLAFIFGEESFIDIQRYTLTDSFGKSGIVDAFYKPQTQKFFSHQDNLKENIRKLIEEGNSNLVSDIACIEDLSMLIDHELLDIYLHSSLKDFLRRSANYIQCPKCNLTFEYVNHTWSSKQSNLINELGIDKKPMDDASQRHYLSNRIRCRGEDCDAIFCRICKAVPYHSGFDCEEYKKFLDAPHCRYCTRCVYEGRNQIKNPPAIHMKDICDSEICIEKAMNSCIKLKSCGHYCCGIKGELNCLPCLFPECNEESKELQNIHDICCICHTDDIGSSPAIQLTSCGHIFHYQCVQDRLIKRWSGNRISFKFMKCPLCDVEMVHPALDTLILDLMELKKKVETKVVERANIEALSEDEHVKNSAGPFFNDMIKYAWEIYAFYLCFKCKQPYFGGRRACGANLAEEANPNEYICPECASISSSGNCNIPDHQEYILWKCRFCCSLAVWFCWGRVHFCEYCHSNDPWGRDTGQYNDEPRARCPPYGLDVCPIGGCHPPNSNAQESEFALGCGICTNEQNVKLRIS